MNEYRYFLFIGTWKSLVVLILSVNYEGQVGIMGELVELYRKNKHALLVRGVGHSRQEPAFLRGLTHCGKLPPPNFTCPCEDVSIIIFWSVFFRPFMPY